MARRGDAAPPRRIRNPFAYGTKSYYEHREKALAARQRAQSLAARRGSKKAEQGARQTGRALEKVRATKRFAETVDRTGTPKHIRHMIRSFDRLSAVERRKVEGLLMTRFREHCYALDINPREWSSAGATLARPLLERHHAPKRPLSAEELKAGHNSGRTPRWPARPPEFDGATSTPPSLTVEYALFAGKGTYT